MALPGPGTFSSLSAETPCYTFNYAAGPFAQTTNVPYVDCNGLSVSIVVSAAQTGTFCARSANSVGQITVDNVGSCSCKTWYSVLYGYDYITYTFEWIDCNGQPAKKTAVGLGAYIPITFYSCSKSKPRLVGNPSIIGGLNQSLEAQSCDRNLVG